MIEALQVEHLYLLFTQSQIKDISSSDDVRTMIFYFRRATQHSSIRCCSLMTTFQTIQLFPTSINKFCGNRNFMSIPLERSILHRNFRRQKYEASHHHANSPRPNNVLPYEFVQSLTTALPHLSPPNTNPYDLQTHGRGESYHTPSPPAAILTPQSTRDVASILQL